jgi:hypothetical protein
MKILALKEPEIREMFSRLRASGITLGPGNLAMEHKPDEFVAVVELVLAVRVYGDLVKNSRIQYSAFSTKPFENGNTNPLPKITTKGGAATAAFRRCCPRG